MKPLSFICIALVFSTIYSLINCSVYGESCRNYSPLSFRFFLQPFVRFQKKIKMSFTSQGWSALGKTVPSVLHPRPQAQFFPKTSHLVKLCFWMIQIIIHKKTSQEPKHTWKLQIYIITYNNKGWYCFILKSIWTIKLK